MKTYSGGIRHDYKQSPPAPRPLPLRAWSMFAAGVSVPLVLVGALLIGETGETNPAVTASAAVPGPTQTVAPPTQTLPESATAPGAGAGPALEPVSRTVSGNDVDAELPPSLDTDESLAGNTDVPLAATREAALPEATTPEAATPETAADDGAAPIIDADAEGFPDFDMLELIVARNDTLDALFRRNGLSIADLAEMLDVPLAAEPLRKLLPGDRLQVVHRGAQVLRLEREIADDRLLAITREPTGFTATEIPRDVELRVVGRHGVVRSSLFEAGMAAQIPDAIIMRMAGIFQWDIDFILDVRTDDHFTLLYQERWREGELLGTGSILAAEYVNRGKAYRIVRFEDPEGHVDYYTEDGRSARKAFVRAPVEFSRISSNFNPNRRHPVLNTLRAHRGVDYAAPSGTPVIAAGDGRVVQRGQNGGFGNSVTIQHGSNITTLYAHLSRFAAPRRGDRVTQGQVIGYVGQTGLATGPHLHYEYRLNGVHRNPRTVDLPPAEPVPAAYAAQFATASGALWTQLDTLRRQFVAAVAPTAAAASGQ